MKVSADIRALIERRKEGYSLEAPFYTSEEIFALDMEAIFHQHWIQVAVEPDIPEPGDYLTVELGGDSILIVRDDDMEIRAFHNVCRHRGARLCNEDKGSVGNIVCPYHSWTYNLTGQLMFAEHMGEQFDRCKHSLKSVHVQNLAGLIFICLAEEPPVDFAQLRAQMEPYLLPHDLPSTKIAAQIDIIEEGNWKLTMENNRECYHCVANHPELTISLYEYGFGYQRSDANAEGMDAFAETCVRRGKEWAEMGLPSAEIEKLLDVTGFRTQRLPLDRSGESQTLDAKVASKKLLGKFEQADLGGLSFWTQPNSWHHFMSDHIVTFSVIPLSAGKTLVRTKWLVHKDAKEGIDYDVKNLTAVWNATNDQDRALVEFSQRGANSSAYEPGPYSPYTEGLVEKFSAWYIGRLAEKTGA
ncbi:MULTISPECIES: aromatic ring-hydroxylating oxygenase subunit alpha [Burkholderia]|uniref:(Fe-S)-binding protein n=1 Tax=Burkholderia diffusa TaxID=488732 RepID=A0A6P2IA02_9BURK|nr:MULTISPECIES: aromatic ring-hydroxylating dioxygenase subunit alpha [Burkholderia]AOI94581.1 (Fe-S)-binding protein [Burkholderia sp. LA-2-3-30-S1-D2]KAB0662545.1 aromatic ring-hydroxylating dioxygenase subunit alpha [Burkholderia diffusa]KVE17947.1 (Fe-S)-binding protein [Burkholderia sp. LA-2-3-30-S1-D2]MBM2653202.1 aromatic ring-hydroxylating dioxygenase subunit alpha [Burkholderia diffusa]VWB26356.1 (Fe-S)-binding protein [Burkholderia diffusa]